MIDLSCEVSNFMVKERVFDQLFHVEGYRLNVDLIDHGFVKDNPRVFQDYVIDYIGSLNDLSYIPLYKPLQEPLQYMSGFSDPDSQEILKFCDGRVAVLIFDPEISWFPGGDNRLAQSFKIRRVYSRSVLCSALTTNQDKVLPSTVDYLNHTNFTLLKQWFPTMPKELKNIPKVNYYSKSCREISSGVDIEI